MVSCCVGVEQSACAWFALVAVACVAVVVLVALVVVPLSGDDMRLTVRFAVVAVVVATGGNTAAVSQLCAAAVD